MSALARAQSDSEPRRKLQRSQGFVEEVFEILRGDIMSLRIPPDSKISIDSLARELGVSQTPIREALSMLEAIGLVTKRHYVGYCAAPQVTRKQLEDLYEVRLMIEPAAARLAAERMSEEQLRALVDLAEQMKPGALPVSYDKFAAQDSELHDLVAAGTGNKIVQDSLSRLHSHFHIFRLRANREVTVEAFSEHARLVEAFERRDGEAAEAAMRDHILKSYQRLTPCAER